MTELDASELGKILKELRNENEQLRNGYVSLSQQLIGLRMVQHIAQDLVAELDVERLLHRILRSAINAVEGQAGALLLLDSNKQELIFSVVEGGGGQTLQGRRIGKDQGLAGWIFSHNQPVIVDDVSQDDRFLEEIPVSVDFEVTSQIGVPLITRGETIGVIQVLNKMGGEPFDDDDLNLLTSFAAQSATAIENARLYQDLKREHDRLIAIEEEVRRRLARDLHDGPAQLLSALITQMEIVRKFWEREPTKALQELEELVPIAREALRQIRTLLFDLRPVILETQGLVPALQLYIQQQQEAGDLAYHLQISGFSGRLVAPAERALFSIVQEAVGNVKKHAWARNVWIAVAEQRDTLIVGVRDDGRGFDLDKLGAEYDRRGSLGLLNMRERAQALGGRLSIHSRPGLGTAIAVTVPLHSLRQTESEES